MAQREFYQVNTVKNKDGQDQPDMEKLNFALRRIFELLPGADSTYGPYGSVFMSSTASMYLGRVSRTIAVTEIDTYYIVDGDFHNGLLGSSFKLVDFKKVKCSTPGVYLANFSVSLNCAVANQDVSACILKNGSVEGASKSFGFLGTAVGKNIALAGACVVQLVANDNLSIGIANHTAANDLTVEFGSIVVYGAGITGALPTTLAH